MIKLKMKIKCLTKHL